MQRRVRPCNRIVLPFAFDVAGQSSSTQADVDKIQHLVAEYAKAVDTADVTLVREIWSNSPDVSFLHPLGQQGRSRLVHVHYSGCR